jgi:hypothetical protein
LFEITPRDIADFKAGVLDFYNVSQQYINSIKVARNMSELDKLEPTIDKDLSLFQHYCRRAKRMFKAYYDLIMTHYMEKDLDYDARISIGEWYDNNKKYGVYTERALEGFRTKSYTAFDGLAERHERDTGSAGRAGARAAVTSAAGGRSALRYKDEVTLLEDTSDLLKLEPVSYIYKDDPDRITQYGLIAEKVQEYYPHLVYTDDSGEVEGIRYMNIISLLLNEVQHLTKRVTSLENVNT